MILLTLPERIALCAYDASTLIRFTAHTRQSTLDSLKRPAVLVEPNEGDYPPYAAGVGDVTETFLLSVIGQKYGQGAKTDAEAEVELRTVANHLAMYFFRRTQLQMSNQRSAQPAALGPLAGVKWIHLSRRTFETTAERDPGEGAFWGTEFTLAVSINVQQLEVLVPSM